MDSFCKDYFPSARKITGVKLAEDKIAIQEAGNVGAITVATNAAGRGIDIGLSPQALKNGGLHVIIPFMPENERILEQTMGRSARQGQPGTVSLYVSRGDCFFSTPKFQKNYEKLLELQSRFSQHIRGKWPWMYKYDGKYNIFKSEYPLGATPYGVLKSMSREFALYIPSCGAIDYAKAEEILTDSMLRMVLVPWGVFFTDLSKNIDEYDDPYDLEVEYQDFLYELHEWLPESCNSFGKMMSYISSSEQLNTIDELSGKVMNFISTVFNFVLPESVKEVLQNRAVQVIMKVTGGVTQITAGCGLCTTLAGAFAGVPMIILGANMAIEGIQDLWHVVKGDLDVQSKNLLKEATGHKVDNILDLADFVSTMGSAKAASKMSSKAFTEASSKLRRELNKARKVETTISEEARLTSKAARQFIRRECGAFRGPKRVAKPVDFGRFFKKHGVKTAPGPGLQPLSEAELEKVVGGAKDPSWRPDGAASAGETKAPECRPTKAADVPKTLTREELAAGLKMKVGSEVFASREEALAQIKRDLGIPRCQEPIRQEMVKLLDEFNNPILDESKNFIYTRELTYSVKNQFDAGGRPITEVIIQDHSYGHEYSSGIGNQGPHYNVRPFDNPINGKVQGLREHYYFDYRNRK